MDIIERLDACDGKNNSDDLKIKIVMEITDPIDLLKVIVKWENMLGDPYYHDFQGAIVEAASRILRGSP